eukprot:CAMPEP_0196137646 /NCGR_PEP_ID=MMETSP0910-20130528/5569_1 /TAXON_ID=49265 /ORGANISM="Thalassiosira rotula, Strain GSO102" /LENGTH=154 /DNA_ID=CAMNT_0041398137 /DNA_START=57 /DNA_END=521 /DNA_ORIENTATION=-
MEFIVNLPRPHRVSSKAKDERSVSFEGYAEVKVIKNIPEKYREDVWFSAIELRSIAYHTLLLRTIASRMTTAQLSELNAEERSEFLGLENYLMSNTTSREITNHRRALRRAVLGEQERQSRADINDPDAMAEIAKELSHWSRESARMIGLIQNI